MVNRSGGVDAVMSTFHKIKYEKGHPNWADFLQTMSAIIQNVCESHYDSGMKNDLHVRVHRFPFDVIPQSHKCHA
jgi:hypothetical protein